MRKGWTSLPLVIHDTSTPWAIDNIKKGKTYEA